MKKRRNTAVLSLKLEEVFDPEFVREVLDRKVNGESTPRAELLKSRTSATLARKKVLIAFAKPDSVPRLSDLTSHSSSDLKRMANIGDKTLKWVEEYLHLLGIVLPLTKSVYGMSSQARDFLATL